MKYVVAAALVAGAAQAFTPAPLTFAVSKKAPTKKAAAKPVKKAAATKPVAKKAAPKPAPKKAAPKKAATKPIVKKAAPKPVVKKAAPKPVVKKAAPKVVKKTTPTPPAPKIVAKVSCLCKWCLMFTTNVSGVAVLKRVHSKCNCNPACSCAHIH